MAGNRWRFDSLPFDSFWVDTFRDWLLCTFSTVAPAECGWTVAQGVFPPCKVSGKWSQPPMETQAMKRIGWSYSDQTHVSTSCGSDIGVETTYIGERYMRDTWHIPLHPTSHDSWILMTTPHKNWYDFIGLFSILQDVAPDFAISESVDPWLRCHGISSGYVCSPTRWYTSPCRCGRLRERPFFKGQHTYVITHTHLCVYIYIYIYTHSYLYISLWVLQALYSHFDGKGLSFASEWSAVSGSPLVMFPSCWRLGLFLVNPLPGSAMKLFGDGFHLRYYGGWCINGFTTLYIYMY